MRAPLYAEHVAFVGPLVHEHPILRPLLQEYVDEFDSLPHLFMGDVVLWCTHRFIEEPRDPTLRQILDYIELSFRTGPEREREIIAVGFLENFPHAREEGAGIRDIVGPLLAERLKRFT